MQLGLGSGGRRGVLGPSELPAQASTPSPSPKTEPVEASVGPAEVLAVELEASHDEGDAALSSETVPKTEPVEASVGPAEVLTVEPAASHDEGDAALSSETMPSDEGSTPEAPSVAKESKKNDWRDASSDWLSSKRRSRTSAASAAAAWQSRMSTDAETSPRHTGGQQERAKLNAEVKACFSSVTSNLGGQPRTLFSVRSRECMPLTWRPVNALRPCTRRCGRLAAV